MVEISTELIEILTNTAFADDPLLRLHCARRTGTRLSSVPKTYTVTISHAIVYTNHRSLTAST